MLYFVHPDMGYNDIRRCSEDVISAMGICLLFQEARKAKPDCDEMSGIPLFDLIDKE